MGVTVNISDQVRPALASLSALVPSESLHKRISANMANLVKRHLIARNQRGNEQGFPRTNFFGHAAESVNHRATASTAEVRVSKLGFGQRYFGGRIEPVKAKALTIPVHPAAYAHRAREFDLDYVPQKAGSRVLGLLVRRHAGRAAGEVFYILVGAVTQKPDPTVLPTDAQFDTTAAAVIERLLRSIAQRGAI